LRPSAETVASLRTLTSDLDLGPVYRATRCPELVVLPTRNAPEQEDFAELYEAHRRFVREQAEDSGVRYVQLADASHAMVIEQPELLASLIADFLAAA
jgi:pimeloyl-ACP methyl ester carboxylesterase